MEVQFEPDVQAKLDRMARESGRAASKLVHDAVAGYVEHLTDTHEMLNSRYDEIKSGKTKLIPGEEIEAYFRDKSAAALKLPSRT